MRMRMTLAVAAALLPQAAPPSTPRDTEIYLATLTRAEGRIVLGQPVDISNNPGYDNQPSFTPEGSAILFTSVRGERKPDPANPAASGSDIYRYDLASARVSQLTRTPESEYSPIVMPDGRHFSAVRVEADGTQRLWRFTIEGTDPALLLPDVKAVGYHAWIDSGRLALYILGASGEQGSGRPSTLQMATLADGSTRIVASNIGRSIQRMPDGRVSFVSREQDSGGSPVKTSIRAWDPTSGRIDTLVDAPEGQSDVDTAWTPDGTLLVSNRTALLAWRPGDSTLSAAVDLAPLGLSGASRLAISPKGDRIAIVALPR
jgi:hypothetical protein